MLSGILGVIESISSDITYPPIFWNYEQEAQN